MGHTIPDWAANHLSLIPWASHPMIQSLGGNVCVAGPESSVFALVCARVEALGAVEREPGGHSYFSFWSGSGAPSLPPRLTQCRM